MSHLSVEIWDEQFICSNILSCAVTPGNLYKFFHASKNDTISDELEKKGLAAIGHLIISLTTPPMWSNSSSMCLAMSNTLSTVLLFHQQSAEHNENALKTCTEQLSLSIINNKSKWNSISFSISFTTTFANTWLWTSESEKYECTFSPEVQNELPLVLCVSGL